MADLIYSVAGLLILLFAGDALVKGAVSLSLKLGVSALVVSLTVVAFGTSAPELLISVQSALAGVPGLALGNVVGSNIANVLLVLGVPALLAPVLMEDPDARRSYVIMLAASLVFICACFLGPLVAAHGAVLLIFLVAFLFDTFRQAERAGGEVSEDDLEGGDANMEWWRVIAFLAAGIIGLPIGAHLLVEGATGIAQHFGVSEAVIGLTLVAIGTSLPELSTTVAATLRGHSEVALGNVIGSNIFNVLAIMGVASFFGPLPLPEGFLGFDLWIMLACSLILFPFVWYGKSMGRVVGVALVGAYVAYLGVVVI